MIKSRTARGRETRLSHANVWHYDSLNGAGAKVLSAVTVELMHSFRAKQNLHCVAVANALTSSEDVLTSSVIHELRYSVLKNEE